MGNQTRSTRTEAIGTATGPAPHTAPNPNWRADDVDIVEVWGQDSFPASDPPANW